MWKKIKSIALAVAIIAVSILAVILRSNFKRSGVGDDSERIGTIKDGLGKLGDSQGRIEEGIGDIGRYNQSAKSGIQSALDILYKAKERTDNS